MSTFKCSKSFRQKHCFQNCSFGAKRKKPQQSCPNFYLKENVKERSAHINAETSNLLKIKKEVNGILKQNKINLQSGKHLPSLKALLCNVVLTELGCSKNYKDNRELTRTLRRLGEQNQTDVYIRKLIGSKQSKYLEREKEKMYEG